MMEIKYSTVYPFPGNYNWSDFRAEGIYIFLTDKRAGQVGTTSKTFFTPLYVGQSAEIGPELLNHYHGSANLLLRRELKQRQEIFVVYASVKGEATRRAVEAYLLSVYQQRGFRLVNVQFPAVTSGFSVNVF